MVDEKKIPTEGQNPDTAQAVTSVADQKQRDYTKEREERTKPVIEAILKMMLDKKLVLSSDISYIENIVNQHLTNILRHVLFENSQAIFAVVQESINNWFDFAVEKKVGKPLKELTLADLQQFLDESKGDKSTEKDVA